MTRTRRLRAALAAALVAGLCLGPVAPAAVGQEQADETAAADPVPTDGTAGASDPAPTPDPAQAPTPDLAEDPDPAGGPASGTVPASDPDADAAPTGTRPEATAATAPVVLTGPTDATVLPGEPARFEVTVAGEPAPTVAWETRAPGASDWEAAGSGAALTLSSVTYGMSGTQVRARATNAAGEAITDPATLTVTLPDGLSLTAPAEVVLGQETVVRATQVPRGTYRVVLVTEHGQEVVLAAGIGSTQRITEAWERAVPVDHLLASDGDLTLLRPGAAWLELRGAARTDPPLAVSAELLLTADAAETAAPRIVTQPQPVVRDGGVAEVTVTGDPGTAFTVYWQEDVRGTGEWETTARRFGAEVNTHRFTPGANPGHRVRAVLASRHGLVVSQAVGLVAPAAPTLVTDLPDVVVVGSAATLTLRAVADGAPAPEVAWSASADGRTWRPVTGTVTTELRPDGWRTTATVSVPAREAATAYRATFTNASGQVTTATVTVVVSDSDVPVRVTAHPVSATVEAGEPVTFTAAATGVPAPQVGWERSTDGGATWHALRGATGTSHTIDAVTAPRAGESPHRFRAVFTNRSGTATTQAAVLTVTPRENVREHCGTSYGPAGHAGVPFCFRGPEKVVVGQDITITGTGGYLATDGVTGSVVNFFLDAEYSGDPNTVFSRRTVTNPATGAVIDDRRTHAAVQARADGTWTVTIPWPTVDTVSPSADPAARYTAEELAALFAPGTSHTIRMLTGSLLSSPADRQRGASLAFTVVTSLTDDVPVTRPTYEHQQFVSTVPGDQAVAWVQQNVGGSGIALSGTGWLTADRLWGSTLLVRLLDEHGEPYPGGTDTTDPSVWRSIRVDESGTFATTVPLPAGVGAGDHVAVELTTLAGTELGDVARHWVSAPLVVDGVPYLPDGQGGSCTAAPTEYALELAPGMTVPAANVGGTIRLVGTGWCNLVGGGSLIAVKINAGGFQHLPGATAAHFDANLGRETGPSPTELARTNKTIWYVIEADDRGSFDVRIPLPTRTSSIPGFSEGAYTLQLLTRAISADPYYAGSRPDPSRTVRTAEFTVVGEGEPLDDVTLGEPTEAPEPLHVDDLTEDRRGGVALTAFADRWEVTVPAAEPGDWVYLNVYDGPSPRFPWSTWFRLDADRRAVAPLPASLPTGTVTVTVQDRQAGLLGWTTTTVTAPDPGRPPVTGSTATVRPAGDPEPPVPGYDDLTDELAGTVTVVPADAGHLVTAPDVPAGEWLGLVLYLESSAVVPIGWARADEEHAVTVEIAGLPDGLHKLAVVDTASELVGWDTLGEAATEAAPAETAPVAAPPPSLPPAEAVAVLTGPVTDTLTYVLLAAALLLLAAAGTGTILLRTPVRAT